MFRRTWMKNTRTSSRLSQTFAVVATDDLSEKVATRVGIKGENRTSNPSSVVFKLEGPYSGYTDRAPWKWLQKNQGESC